MSEPKAALQKSTFVTVIGWIFVIISGFMTAISTLQNIMVNSMFTETNRNAIKVPTDPNVPAFFTFMANHMQLFFVAFLAVSSVTFVSSLGLLRRKNWARVTFIGILVFGIIWNLASLAFMATMFSSFQPPKPPAGAPDMESFKNAIVVFNVVFMFGLSGVFAWIIKRLCSEAISAEFT